MRAEVIGVCGVDDPAGVGDALVMLDRALAVLAAADAGSLPTAVQAQALRVLERAEARHTAVRARVLAAFTTQDGCEDDGHGSARVWLAWQTRVTGPEDTRTATQRRHDALEEACRRLIAAGMVPGRAGQPTQIVVHMGLGQLRDLPGASAAEAAWAAGRARHPGWLTGPDAAAAACDASMVPVVTGHVDRAGPAGRPLSRESRRRLRTALLALAADALSGPGGLTAELRTGLDRGPLTTISLPLDIGPASETIPVHLRRAVTTRHGHCAFPGCDQPTSTCDIHHLIPRSESGPTALRNLVPLCSFHHTIVIHRWGWTLTLHPDGTTTATSPHGRTLHSHGPPGGGHGPPDDGHGPPGCDHGPPGCAA